MTKIIHFKNYFYTMLSLKNNGGYILLQTVASIFKIIQKAINFLKNPLKFLLLDSTWTNLFKLAYV